MLIEEGKQPKIIDDERFPHLCCFLKESFKEGLVCDDAEELKKCFSYDVKNKAVCFFQSGKEKEKDLMIIFYPYYCFMPLKYRSHLRNEGPCKTHILTLNYQKFLSKYLYDDVENLSILLYTVEKEHKICDSPSNYKDIYRRPDGATIFRSFTDYEIKFAEVYQFVKRKLKGISVEPSYKSLRLLGYLKEREKWKAEKIKKLRDKEKEEIKRS